MQNERIKKAYNNTQLNEVLNAILKDSQLFIFNSGKPYLNYT